MLKELYNIIIAFFAVRNPYYIFVFYYHFYYFHPLSSALVQFYKYILSRVDYTNYNVKSVWLESSHKKINRT